MTLPELIAALEKLEVPSREMDADIALLVGYRCKGSKTRIGISDGLVWAAPGENFSYGTRPPIYTASLDDAQTLILEGSYGFAFPWFYSEYSKKERNCVLWRAAILKPIWKKATPSLAGDDWFERVETDDAATPAIALVIAALKARLSSKESPS